MGSWGGRSGKLYSVATKTNFHQTHPFPETHNLLSAQIKACLFISTHKSLHSKVILSHRFTILPVSAVSDTPKLATGNF